MNKKYFLYVIIPAVTIASAGIIAVSTASANSTVKMGNHMANMVAVIAQKFNLNPSDVQQVFDQQMTQTQMQMQQKLTDNLNKAVTDGKLTQVQANLIIAKKTELNAQKISLQGKTKQEISTFMKSHSDLLKQWAKDNSIPMQYLTFGRFGINKRVK